MEWKVTKYHPTFELAVNVPDEWTSMSDIGKTFSSHRLDAIEYLTVEASYLDAISDFLDDAGINFLVVREMDKHRNRGKEAARMEKYGLRFCASSWDRVSEGMLLNRAQILEVSLLVLRESLWCRLESDQGFFVHFGYDFYMYIGSPNPSPSAVARARKLGLNVEEFSSPYRLPWDENREPAHERKNRREIPGHSEPGFFERRHEGALGFDRAVAAARYNAGNLGDDSKQLIDHQTGTLCGEYSADNERGWLLKDKFVFWWNWAAGSKDASGRYGHEYFE
ncbi:MAG: hypothetical protein H0U74_18860 [Bradymonadaceae bacterium]|nr:hypothetical protein [Lujinxingiaceae bacterium]